MLAAAILIDLSMVNRNEGTTETHNTIRFVEPKDCWDNEITLDVGQCTSEFAEPDPPEQNPPNSWKKMILGVKNAYPRYKAHYTFTLKNIGDDADEIEGLNVSDPSGGLSWEWKVQYTQGALWKDSNGNNQLDPGEEVIEVTITDLVDLQLAPGASIQAQLDVQVTQNAEQSQVYGLQIEIGYNPV